MIHWWENWHVTPKISPNSNCRWDLDKNLTKKTCITLIDGWTKGACSPETGQKVVFSGRKGIFRPQNRAQKGKRAIRPQPALIYTRLFFKLISHSISIESKFKVPFYCGFRILEYPPVSLYSLAKVLNAWPGNTLLNGSQFSFNNSPKTRLHILINSHQISTAKIIAKNT